MSHLRERERRAKFRREMKDTHWYLSVQRKVASQMVTGITSQSMSFIVLL
jgi:hypothetical protein